MAQYQDLLKDSSKPWPDDKNYFKLTITDLDPGMSYPLEFRWVYTNDKPEADREWSVVKTIQTPSETINAPQFLSGDLAVDGFNLIVQWSGFDYNGNAYDSNLDRVDIYIKGGQYGSTLKYSGRSFKKSGKEIFSFNTSDTYYVRLKAVSKRGSESSFSNELDVTTVAPLIVDIVGPANVSSVTTSGGIDTSGYLGFNAYADISWSAVSDTTLRGYRIRFSNDGGTTYSYVDSPGTGTSYRLGGLAIGSTYQIAVATYDHLNNTSSSYISGSNVTVTGTPSVSNYIAGGPFQFGVGVGGTSTNKGLYFDSSNYWYVNASNSARLKLGGSTSNYLYWDGSTFTIDGNITARGGSFSGNVAMTATGASIYNGTLDGNGALSSDGFILNKSGLQFKYNGNTSITLQTSDGTLIATSATITGTIRTAASTSYPRVELNSTSNKDYVKFYDGIGALGVISVTGGGDGAMYFTSPGSTAGATASASQIALYGPGHATNPKITRLVDADATYRIDITTSGIYGKIHGTNVELVSITSSGLHFNSDYNALGVDNTHVDGSFIRNIQSTTTTGYPTASGRYGDIVLVREA